MVVATSWTFGQLMWSMLVFFTWILFFWMLFAVIGDIFRRHDISGWGKAGWIIFTVFLPFLGIFVYLIANSKGMAERNMRQMQDAQASTDAYIKSVAAAPIRQRRSRRDTHCWRRAQSRRPSSSS